MSMIITDPPVKTETIKEVVTKNDIKSEKETNMKETITKKKQITKRVVSLIVTHQARIRCFLDMIIKGKRIEKKEDIFDKIANNRSFINSTRSFKNGVNMLVTNITNKINSTDESPRKYDLIEKEEKEEEIRFKNCSILRLCINKENGVCLQLVHEGELDPGEGKGGRSYYITNDNHETFKKTFDVTDKDDVNEIIFENINTGLNRLGLKSNDFLKDIDEYVFYIGRHGQADHNLKRSTHLITDTNVTNLGKEQAFRAGKKLITVLKNNNEYINYVFASDLTRTRQTIENILKGMNENQNKIYFPKEIIILPCSHELKYNSKGCDKKQFIKIGTKENDPKCSKTTYCTGNNIENLKSDCSQITIVIVNSGNKVIKKIPLNWDFYFKKNENKVRNMDCSKTNMIKLAVEYINTSVPININENVLTTTKIITEPVSLVNDDCLAECMNNLFFDNSTINIDPIKESVYFKIFKEFFKDVYEMKDFDKKNFDEFHKFIGKNTSDYDNKDHDNDIFNKFIECLKNKCGKKIGPPSPSQKLGEKSDPLSEERSDQHEPLPEETREKPPPPLSKKTKTSTNGSDKSVNNINSPLFWYQSLNNNPEIFYNKIKNIARKDDTRDLFDEIMDRIIESSEKFYKMIQEYKINKDNDIGFIIDYLDDRLYVNDKNAINFMEYIKSRDIDLYNEIHTKKETGGKKTRKNRKAKKRFVKKTKRTYKKNKTRRRLVRKII
uniref:Uncharacterized protein n=1 Tax=viral metagenome TaxID=1070528 RepID=A0A6C0HAS6_9ZZZZ